jgi:hypothetical protein
MDRRYLLKQSLALGGLLTLGGCATAPRHTASMGPGAWTIILTLPETED